MTKSHDRPKRQKRRPRDFAEKPEPREPRERPAGVASEPVDEALMAALYGPNWRQTP
jgi:hypothetical protein